MYVYVYTISNTIWCMYSYIYTIIHIQYDWIQYILYTMHIACRCMQRQGRGGWATDQDLKKWNKIEFLFEFHYSISSYDALQCAVGRGVGWHLSLSISRRAAESGAGMVPCRWGGDTGLAAASWYHKNVRQNATLRKRDRDASAVADADVDTPRVVQRVVPVDHALAVVEYLDVGAPWRSMGVIRNLRRTGRPAITCS